jgi:hypothetical protein
MFMRWAILDYRLPQQAVETRKSKFENPEQRVRGVERGFSGFRISIYENPQSSIGKENPLCLPVLRRLEPGNGPPQGFAGALHVNLGI